MAGVALELVGAEHASASGGVRIIGANNGIATLPTRRGEVVLAAPRLPIAAVMR